MQNCLIVVNTKENKEAVRKGQSSFFCYWTKEGFEVKKGCAASNRVYLEKAKVFLK
jgi:hypothetical protein